MTTNDDRPEPDDVPPADAAAGRGAAAGDEDDATHGGVSRRGSEPGDAPLTEEEVERMLAALGAVEETTEPGSPDATGAPPPAGSSDATGSPAPEPAGPGAAPERPGSIAVVLTPVASASALAGLCAMSGIDVDVVPSGSGAIAVLQLAPKAPTDEWDISELMGADGGASVPPEAEELAVALSKLLRAGVLLLTAELATDVGIESGLSGQIHARRYTGGESDGDVPAGLVLASADQLVEDLVLARVRPEDVRGHERTGKLPRWKAARMFGRGLRRRKP